MAGSRGLAAQPAELDDEEALANDVNSELNIAQRMYQIMDDMWTKVGQVPLGSLKPLGNDAAEEDVREVIAKAFVSSATTVALEGGPYQLGGGDLLPSAATVGISRRSSRETCRTTSPCGTRATPTTTGRCATRSPRSGPSRPTASTRDS